MKKILVGFFAIACICAINGCKSQDQGCDNCTPKSSLFGSFGGEHYIWENWVFTTNRVDDVK